MSATVNRVKLIAYSALAMLWFLISASELRLALDARARDNRLVALAAMVLCTTNMSIFCFGLNGYRQELHNVDRFGVSLAVFSKSIGIGLTLLAWGLLEPEESIVLFADLYVSSVIAFNAWFAAASVARERVAVSTVHALLAPLHAAMEIVEGVQPHGVPAPAA